MPTYRKMSKLAKRCGRSFAGTRYKCQRPAGHSGSHLVKTPAVRGGKLEW